MSTFKGGSLDPAFLYITDIDGMPFLFRVVRGSFDAQGDWVESFVVPPDPTLTGLDITFLVFGLVGGTVEVGNQETVSFR